MLRQSGCFAKERRLSNPADFQRSFRSSCRSIDATILVAASRNNLGYARLGLAISGKWVRTAVERNRIKRLVRESFRRNQGLLIGLDIVVTTNKTPARLSNKDINSSMMAHWQRLMKCKKY